MGAGGGFMGSLAKFANAVWRLRDSSASTAVAVDLSYVPKRMGTISSWTRGVVQEKRSSGSIRTWTNDVI